MKDETEITFKCPACGGAHFGRDTGGDPPGPLATVRCHDEFTRGCTWRGLWPPEGFIITKPRAHRALWAKNNPQAMVRQGGLLSPEDLERWACDICSAPLDPDGLIPVIGRSPEGHSLCPKCAASHDVRTWPTCGCEGCRSKRDHSIRKGK